MEFVNLTPHTICLYDGRNFQPSGTVARVTAGFSDVDSDGISKQVFGDVENLPTPVPGVCYVVSRLVLKALGGSRQDVIAAALYHSRHY